MEFGIYVFLLANAAITIGMFLYSVIVKHLTNQYQYEMSFYF
jgi:hypothetical protein